MSRLLINEPPLMVLPSLAVKIGLNEAIFVQQLHYLLQMSQNHKDGKSWVYNTLEEWSDIFPFLSLATLRRVIKSLENSKILATSTTMNRYKVDRTKWYSLDYDVLNAIAQNEHMDCSERTNAIAQNEHFTSAQNEHMSSAQNEHTNNHKNKTTTKTTNNREGNTLIDYLISLGVEEQNAQDFIKYRHSIKKPLTKTAIDRLVTEVNKNGKVNLNDMVAEIQIRGWISFKSHYDVDGSSNKTGSNHDLSNQDYSKNKDRVPDFLFTQEELAEGKS